MGKTWLGAFFIEFKIKLTYSSFTLIKYISFIPAPKDFVEPTIAAIIDGARTNTVGDGKIFVMDLQECIRIRTGERDNRAIG